MLRDPKSEPHIFKIQPYRSHCTDVHPLNYEWLQSRQTFLLSNMADQHGEHVEPQCTNTYHPAAPHPASLGLEPGFDDSFDDPELQLTQSISHSEDPGNSGGSDTDFLFDAELARLDPNDSTPTQSLFPPLSSLARLSCFVSPAGYHTAEYSRDELDNDMTATSPAHSGVSPSSSPRLPSPPPFTEVQIGPKSSSVGDANQDQLGDAARLDNGSTRRVRSGTKAADMERGPPLVPLNEVNTWRIHVMVDNRGLLRPSMRSHNDIPLCA